METEEKKLEEILSRQRQQTERYLGTLKEDFDHKLDAVLEYVKDVPAIKEKQDIMFDQMGEMAENLTIVTEAVKNHEERLQQSEARS
jgi:hypothetical protein